ncbi:methyltransferase [Achlya hypogyna]|uniref:Methyltransferase n=1 Tax=Achlya hypogyna TaxID=1202772 RepID=A0A1V9YQC0_ACHHY|nr:methyltransferase [Achlya hypogyna]
MLRRPVKSSAKKMAKTRRLMEDVRESGDGTYIIHTKRHGDLLHSDVEYAGDGAYDHDVGDMYDLQEPIGWLNCECFLSLLLVGVLVALPFNLHSTKDLLQSRETYLFQAAEMVKVGACDDAVMLYERALVVQENAFIHNQLADALSKCGRTNDALDHYLSGIRLEETHRRKIPSLISMGDLYQKIGEYALAVKSFDTVVLIMGDAKDAKSHELGEIYMKLAKAATGLGDYEQALRAYTSASTLVSGDAIVAEVHYRMGHCAAILGRMDVAVAALKKAAVKAPPSQKSLYLYELAYAYFQSGDYDRGNDGLDRLFAMQSMYPEDRYMKAAFYDRAFPPLHRAPSQYISTVFDLLAQRSLHLAPDTADLSAVLRQLHGLFFVEAAPARISALLQDKLGVAPGDHWLDVVDFGAGTGAAMTPFRALSNYVLGIDLSAASVDIARRSQLYDELKVGDLIQVAAALTGGTFDVVLAMNTAPYFGDLRQVFEQGHRLLRVGGLFCLNTDQHNEMAESSFALGFTGRWAHKTKYITQLAAEYQMEVFHHEVLEDARHVGQSPTGQLVPLVRPTTVRSDVLLLRKTRDEGFAM